MPIDGMNNNKKASDIVKRQLYKTKMCTFFLNGKCTRGNSCVFAHCLSELRPLPDLRNTRLCYALSDGRPCNEKNCPYAHNLMDLRVTDLELLQYRMNLISKKLEMASVARNTNGQLPLRGENIFVSELLKDLDDSSLALLYQWVKTMDTGDWETFSEQARSDNLSSNQHVSVNQSTDFTKENSTIDICKSIDNLRRSSSYTESRFDGSVFEKSSFQNVTSRNSVRTELKQSISIKATESNIKIYEEVIEGDDNVNLKLLHQWLSNLPSDNNKNNMNTLIPLNGSSKLSYQHNLN